MSNMVGTVINVKSLYSSNASEIQFKNGTESKLLISLKENRKYIIPFFQRELRWNKENLITLVNDISKGSKFLGNLIFAKKNDDYEILDGQQRTTIILLIIQYIRSKYQDRIEIFDTSELCIESFEGFSKLYKHDFKVEDLTSEEREQIIASDKYGQISKFLDFWKYMDDINEFSTVAGAEDFMKNLEASELNVIIETDSIERSIEAFLDVNLKGVKLDTEDIFKGYLFAQDNSESMHLLWSELKELHIKLAEKIDYPFMMLIEHYFQIALYEIDEYKEIDFSSEFTLKTEKTVEGNRYSAGEHVVKIVHNRKFLKDSLEQLKAIMELMVIIVQESSAPSTFKTKLQKSKVDNDEIDVIYNLVRKVTLDSNKIPKCLVIKFLLNTFINNADTKSYESIYGVFAVATFFSLFETKKKSDGLFKIIRSDDWDNKMYSYVNNCFEARELSNRQISAGYQYSLTKNISERTERQEFRCKSIATLYNFLVVNNQKIKVKAHKMKELQKFLNNSEAFSVEHFIVNNGGKCKVTIANDTVFDYEYPAEIKKYKNSLFNYIFIERDLNSRLEHLYIYEKLSLLKAESGNEMDTYSKDVVALIDSVMTPVDVSGLTDECEAKNKLNEYYINHFKGKYAELVKQIVRMISEGDK